MSILRVTTMYEKACLFLAIVLHVAIVLESRVIVPPTEDGSSGNEEIPYLMNPLQTETCGRNEVYSDCVNPCNDCQTPRNIPCNFLVCNKGCDCRPGYTRNDQRMCIPESLCRSGKKLDPPAAGGNDYDEGIPIISRPPYNDYNEPDIDDDLPRIKPEKFPSGAGRDKRPQENPKENDGIDKSGDDNLNKPLDKEDSDDFDNNDKDLGPSLDEAKTIDKDGDGSEVEYAGPEESEKDKKHKEHKPEEEKPDEEKEEELDEEKPDEEKEEELDEEKPDEEKKDELDEEKPDEEKEEELDEEKLDEEKKDEEEEERKLEEEEHEERRIDEENEEKHELETGDDKKDVTEEESIDDNNEEEKIPEEVAEEIDENDTENKDGIPDKGGVGSFSDGSIFDTPFFNIDKVKKYFSQLDRALGHVFRQTMDEALLLNGTYANTTEEEVDIDGKKYIITKSVIKGADNHSSMYIESLSAKPKMNDSEGIKDIEIKNLTQT